MRALHSIGLIVGAILLAMAGAADAQHVRRIAPDNLPGYWLLSQAATDALVPNSGQNLHVPVCVSVRYRIGSDGAVHNATLGKSVPVSDLAKTAVAIVGNFRYVRGDSNAGGEPVDTWYTVQFNMRNLSAADKAKHMAPCDLPGYGN